MTGATGFVGQWLVRDLEAAEHEVVAAPGRAQLDITDRSAVREMVGTVRPQAIAHLAGVSYAGDARDDPGLALAVNEGGTRVIIEAAARLEAPPMVLVTGSSEVYGHPRPSDLPLRETAPLLADQPYGLPKLAQERAAIETGATLAVPVVVARSFNHTGPGQRREFVAPALVSRVLDAKKSGSVEIVVGNLDVRRDLGDVRDVVRAYRLLIEGAVSGAIASGSILNVATGESISIRDILAIICDVADISVEPRVDAGLVRANDPREIRGDPTELRRITGWAPTIPLPQTLGDLVDSIMAVRPPISR